MNILFTCAGRRNYMIRYFKESLMGNGNIFAADMEPSAPALADADKAFIVPPIYSESYIDILWDICTSVQVDAVISLNDLELPILADNKERFSNAGITLIIASKEVIDLTFDKLKTALYANEVGLNTPLTYSNLNEAQDAINQKLLRYPVILKPRWGSASIGIEIAHSEEELRLTYQLLNLKLRRTILAEVSNQAPEEAIIIQEYLNGQEYGVDIINDLNGNYRATIVKRKISMRSGETDKAITVHNASIDSMGETIGKSLKHVGNLDCDIIQANDAYYLLEMNCRFGGGYPFSHEAGANIPTAYIKWLAGEEVSDELFAVEEDCALSKYDNLMKIKI